MARLGKYTDKQLAALEPLEREAAMWKRRSDELGKQIADPSISYEEMAKKRKARKIYDDKYKSLTKKMERIMNANTECQEYIRRSQECIEKAEKLSKEYGPWPIKA